MSTNLHFRGKTKQVRIRGDWHPLLKVEAAKRGISMTALHDEIYGGFFGKKEADKKRVANC